MVKVKREEIKNIKFQFEASGAKEVMLAGDFNNWDGNSTPLRKSRGEVWHGGLSLKPGRYEYKFIVDGNWVTDPNNGNRALNSFGTENSVLEI